MTGAFAQTLPADRKFSLVRGDKRSPQLVYADVETGDEITVPSVWYNQPVEWRADYLRFCADRKREGAIQLRKLPFPKSWELTQADDNDRAATALDAKADALLLSGRRD